MTSSAGPEACGHQRGLIPENERGVVGVEAEHVEDAYSAALADVESEWLANAMAVSVAVYASVQLVDRLCAAAGMTIVVETTGNVDVPIAGRLVEAGPQAFVMRTAAAWYVVPVPAVSTVRGLPRAQQAPASGPRVPRPRTWGAMVRPHIGTLVEICVEGRRTSGLLVRVGADHLEVRDGRGDCVVAASALSWLRVGATDEDGTWLRRQAWPGSP